MPKALERVYVAGAMDEVPQFSSTDEFIEILQQIVDVKRTIHSSSTVGEMDNSAFFSVSSDEKMRSSSPFITAPEAFEWSSPTCVPVSHTSLLHKSKETHETGLTSDSSHTYLPQKMKKLGTGHADIVRRVDGKVTIDSFRSLAVDEVKTVGLNCLSHISDPELTSLSQDWLQQKFTGARGGHDEVGNNIQGEPKSLTDLIAYYNSKSVNATQLHDVTRQLQDVARQLSGRQIEKKANSVDVKLSYENVRHAHSSQSGMMADTHSHSTLEEESEQCKDMAGLNNARDCSRNEADEKMFLQAPKSCLPAHQEDGSNDREDLYLLAFESSVDVKDYLVQSTQGNHVNSDQTTLVHEIDCCIDSHRVIPPEFDRSVDEKESSVDSLKQNPNICAYESPVDIFEYNKGNQEKDTIYTSLEHMPDISGCNSRQQKEGCVKSSVEECAQDYTELTLFAKKGPVDTGDCSTNGHMGSIADLLESHRNIDEIGHNSVYKNSCCIAANVESDFCALGSDLESNTYTKDVNGFADTIARDMKIKGLVEVADITVQNKGVADTHECIMGNKNIVESNKCSVEHEERQPSETDLCILNGPLYLNECASEQIQLEQCNPDVEVTIKLCAEDAVTEGHEFMAEGISKEGHQAMIVGAIIEDLDLMKCVNYEGDYKATVEQCKISEITTHPLNMQAKGTICNRGSVVEPQLNQWQFDEAAPDYTDFWHEAVKRLVTEGIVSDKHQCMDSCKQASSRASCEHQVLNSCNLDNGAVNHERLMQDSCNMDRSKVNYQHQIIESCNLVSNKVDHDKSKCKVASEIDNCDVVKGQVIFPPINDSHNLSEAYVHGGVESSQEMSCSQEDCDTQRMLLICDIGNDVSIHCCNIPDVPDYIAKLSTNLCEQKRTDNFCAGKKISWQIPANSRSCSEMCTGETDSYASNGSLALTNEMTGHISNVSGGIDNKKELDTEVSEEISFPSTSILCDNETEDASGDVTEDINGDSRPVWRSIIGFDHLSSDVSCPLSSTTGVVKTGLAASSDTEPGPYQFKTVGASETGLETDEISHVNSLHIVIGGRDGELQLPSPLFKAFEREVGSVYCKYLNVNKMLHRSGGSCTQDYVSDCRCRSEPAAELALMATKSEGVGFGGRLCLANQGKHNYTCSTGKVVVKCSSLNSLQRIFDSHPSFECAEMKELTFQPQRDGQGCFWKTSRNQTECEEEHFNIDKVQLEQLSGTYVQTRENKEIRNDSLFANLDKGVVRIGSAAAFSRTKRLGSSPMLNIKVEPDSAHLASLSDVPRTSSFTTDKTMKLSSENLQQEDFKFGIQFTQHDRIMEQRRNSEHCWHCVVPSFHERSFLNLAKIDTEDYRSEMLGLATGMAFIRPERVHGHVGSIPCPLFSYIPDLEHEHLLQNTPCSSHLSREDIQTTAASSKNMEVMPQKVNVAVQKTASDSSCNSVNRKFDIAVQKRVPSAEIGRNSANRKAAGMTEKDRAHYLFACRCPDKTSLTSRRQKTTSREVETLQTETGLQEEMRSYLTTLFWVCLALAILIFDLFF
ncbi:hypothetical protein BsWGS_21739 [Bradybaena similaris]